MRGGTIARGLTAVLAVVSFAAALSCSKTPSAPRTFATPDDAVKALIDATKGGKLDDLKAIFGPDVQRIVDSSDAATARRNQQIFTAAAAERWRLEDDGQRKTLVIGNEEWPFPVPL